MRFSSFLLVSFVGYIYVVNGNIYLTNQSSASSTSLCQLQADNCQCSCNTHGGLLPKLEINCSGTGIATRSFGFPTRRTNAHIPKLFSRAVSLTLNIKACTDNLILAPNFLSGLHYSFQLKSRSIKVMISDMDHVQVRGGAFDVRITPSKSLFVQAIIDRIKNLTITTHSFHGPSLETIKLTRSGLSSMSQESFSNLALDSLMVEGCNISSIPTQAIGSDVQVNHFNFVDNWVGKVDKGSIGLVGRDQITFSSNSFKILEENAFQDLNATKLKFKGNSLGSFVPRMLSFGIGEDQIDFADNTILEVCHCKLLYQHLFSENSSFLPELWCLQEDQPAITVVEYIKTVCSDKNVRSGLTPEHLDWCQLSNQSIVCDCHTTLAQTDVKMDKSTVLKIEFRNCPAFELHVKEITDFPQLETFIVSGTGSLQIFPLESPKEPREKGGVKLFFNNVTLRDAIKPDTFCGPNFKEIVFQDSEINFIDRKAFHELTQLDLIEFQNCHILGDISKQAFLNVTVKQFLIDNSNLGTLDTKSFGLQVEEAFLVLNTNISDIHTHAWKPIELLTEDTRFILKHVWVTERFEEGSLEVSNPDQLEAEHVVLPMDCDCDMHDIELVHHDQPRFHHDLSTLVSNLWCLGQTGELIKWKLFDHDHCDDEEGHDHSFLAYDEKGLHLTKWAVLAIILVLALIIVMVIGVILKFKNNPILAPHLPIVDEDDDENWKRISFEAMRYRSKSSGQQDLRTRRRESLPGMLQPPGYHTHPSLALFHRVSIKSLKQGDGLMHETETFELHPRFDRTLDIIQDTHPDRISARQSIPVTSV
ncbi:uncharacterized protein LOC131885944 isoform X2 [Tigriopus californicus]|uniref:uncharacterized protein LOC131885944 isoform X2 n=1 Tax=Tigriopus californicus TaxID=6832 RepID=UPI0027D9F9DE|nr:uncharacterized protein LOC131885944 isoform X2 [Tigriopus californicus]